MKPAAVIAIAILLTLTLALPAAAAAAGSKTIPVTSSADDAWIEDGPPNYNTASTIALQEEFGTLAYRVPLDLPKDSTITAAYLQLTVAANSTQCYSPATYEPGYTQWNGITFEAIDQAENYDTGPLITQRDYIAPSIAVTIPAMSAGMTWTSPNLASQLQQIIERPGWQPGNYVAAAIGVCNGSEERIDFYSYDGNPALAPRLIIEYTYPTRIYMITLPSGALGIVEMRASFGELAVIIAAAALALLTLWAQLRQAAWLISKRSSTK